MTQMTEGHAIEGVIARETPVGELSHLDLDGAIEHARQLRVVDHLRWTAIQFIGRWRYSRSNVRRALYPGISDRADPAR